MDVYSRVCKVIKNLSESDVVTKDNVLRDDLMLDSLLMTMMIIDLEDEFKVEFGESDMNPLALITVSDVVELVERYMNDE